VTDLLDGAKKQKRTKWSAEIKISNFFNCMVRKRAQQPRPVLSVGHGNLFLHVWVKKSCYKFLTKMHRILHWQEIAVLSAKE
jgi:ABC-type microcin C transport system permease subunit YejE